MGNRACRIKSMLILPAGERAFVIPHANHAIALSSLSSRITCIAECNSAYVADGKYSGTRTLTRLA